MLIDSHPQDPVAVETAQTSGEHRLPADSHERLGDGLLERRQPRPAQFWVSISGRPTLA